MFKWFINTLPSTYTHRARRPVRDALDHPEVAAMSARELADLPLVAPAAPLASAPVVSLAEYRARRTGRVALNDGLCLS